MNHFLSVDWVYYNIASVSYFWFFGPEASGIIAPKPGIEPIPSVLEGKALTTGLPGKSLFLLSEV